MDFGLLTTLLFDPLTAVLCQKWPSTCSVAEVNFSVKCHVFVWSAIWHSRKGEFVQHDVEKSHTDDFFTSCPMKLVFITLRITASLFSLLYSAFLCVSWLEHCIKILCFMNTGQRVQCSIWEEESWNDSCAFLPISERVHKQCWKYKVSYDSWLVYWVGK